MSVTTPVADLRQRLVAATAEVIDEDGPLAVRVDKIARRAGCSRATVYRYVADKDELVREVLVSRSAEIAARLEVDIDDSDDPAAWIVNGLLGHAEAIRAEPWFQALDRQGATAAIARVGGGPQAVAALAVPIVARFLKRITDRGVLRSDITVAEATEWLVDVHVTLLSPLFAGRAPHQRARALHKFVAYSLLVHPLPPRGSAGTPDLSEEPIPASG
jgi:AcrR family transcriptional regulator